MRNAERRIGAGQTALITGGGTGIGRGIALALARRGVAVALAGRRVGPLVAVVDEVLTLGARAAAFPADLTDAVSRQRIVAQIHEQFGPIDILINDAALLHNGSLGEQTAAAVDRLLATNLTAPIALTQLCLPDLVAQKGSVVFIGSTTSFVPLPYMSLYSATKAGLHAFGRSLRHELQPMGVQLLTAYPPATATAMTAAMHAHMQETSWGAQFKLATPERVGERIVQALLAGKRECIWWSGEHLLRLAYGFAPRLVDWLLYTQRRRLAATLGVGERASM